MKRNEIVQYLKNRILSGELAPESFLPLRSELIQECKASNVTVQHAVNRLIADGFLRSCGSKGIMVEKHPPHKSRFGILLPASTWPEKQDFDTKHYAVEKALDIIETEDDGISFIRYHVGRETTQHDDEFKKLEFALSESLIAGVIVPFSLPDGLLLPLEGYPVVMHEPRNAKIIRAVSFNHNYTALAEMAVRELVRSGAKKIAVIMGAEIPLYFVSEIKKMLYRQTDIITRDEWIQSLSVASRGITWANHLLKLMFMPEITQKPDGMIILNENLLRSVVENLQALDMVIGRDIHICSHCNIPSISQITGNISFQAFDWCDIIRKSIRCITRFDKFNHSYFGREFLLPPKVVKQFSPQPYFENITRDNLSTQRSV